MQDTFGDTGKIVAIVPVGAILMLILMYNLASTADDYLSPSLEYLTVKLGISESLSGVTFLAFGNGAPDVFSAISANGGDPEQAQANDTLLSLCGLLGATVFISSVVQVLTLRASRGRTVNVTPVFFKRDLIFYFVMVIYLLIITLVIKKMNIFVAFGFLVMYAVYVILVVVHGKKYPSAADQAEEEDKMDVKINDMNSEFTSEIRNQTEVEQNHVELLISRKSELLAKQGETCCTNCKVGQSRMRR